MDTSTQVDTRALQNISVSAQHWFLLSGLIISEHLGIFQDFQQPDEHLPPYIPTRAFVPNKSYNLRDTHKPCAADTFPASSRADRTIADFISVAGLALTSQSRTNSADLVGASA